MNTNSAKKRNKKTVIVQILQILYNHTSYDYPVTQTALADYLNGIGVPCSRKTVGRALNDLRRLGVPICRRSCRNGGYYYDFDNDTFFVRNPIHHTPKESP